MVGVRVPRPPAALPDAPRSRYPLIFGETMIDPALLHEYLLQADAYALLRKWHEVFRASTPTPVPSQAWECVPSAGSVVDPIGALRLSPPSPPPAPTYDGWTAEECLAAYEANQRDDASGRRPLSPAQTAAARAEWSARLAVRVSASDAADDARRPRVVADGEDE